MGAHKILGRVDHGDRGLGNIKLDQCGTTTFILPSLFYRHVMIQVHAMNDCESVLSENIQSTV